jgi:hypothetical protein
MIITILFALHVDLEGSGVALPLGFEAAAVMHEGASAAIAADSLSFTYCL